MRKWLYLALVAFAFSACSLFGGKDKEPQFRLSDLQGYWQEVNTEHYVRFTTEKSDENPYLLGYEWDDAEWEDPDMTFEEYLLWNREQLGHPGNGWFKYHFEVTNGGLHELHLMDNEGADIPKEYVVTTLTADKLVYYEKDHKNFVHTFNKVVLVTNEK